MKTLDIVTSAFNEEECLPEFFSRINKVMLGELNYRFRILVMDNGSTDSTWNIIQNAALKDQRIIGFKMSKNFSLDAAFTNGLDQAEGDCAILMASDLQDSPEAIPKLLRKFEEGYDHVLVKIVSRDSVPILRRKLTQIFYRISHKMTSGVLPEGVSDFRLMSKKTYMAVNQLRESHRFIRGIGAWVGFKTTIIELTREPRFAGESKWLAKSIFSVIAQAMSSILAYSSKPLTWLAWSGFILGFGSIVLFILLVIFWVLFGVPFAGFGSIVAILFIAFSLFMLAIGIIAQYLGLIYEEVKQRPLYIVSETTKLK